MFVTMSAIYCNRNIAEALLYYNLICKLFHVICTLMEQLMQSPLPTNRFIHVTDVVRPRRWKHLVCDHDPTHPPPTTGPAAGSRVPPPPPPPRPRFIHTEYFFWSQKINRENFQHKNNVLNKNS